MGTKEREPSCAGVPIWCRKYLVREIQSISTRERTFEDGVEQ